MSILGLLINNELHLLFWHVSKYFIYNVYKKKDVINLKFQKKC